MYTGKRGEAFRLIKDGDTVGNWGGKVAHMEKVDLSFLRFYEREGLIKLLG